MATRRQFLLAGTAWSLAPGAFAQQRLPTVGVLNPRPLEMSMVARPVLEALAQLGYRDGKEIRIEYRSREGSGKGETTLARELVELKCDLILALGTESGARALRGSAVPVVFFAVDYDPLQKGIVDNLRRPSGNMTGVYGPVLPLAAKKLEIALEVLPSARRLFVISDIDSADQLATLRAAASKRSVELFAVEYERRPYDVAGAFTRARGAGVDGFIGLSSPGLATERATVAKQVASHKMPAFVGRTFMAEFGFVVAYTIDFAKAARQVAHVAVRVLRGAKPSDVAVEQAGDFELVVNLRVARTLGLKVPYSVLARATQLIE